MSADNPRDAVAPWWHTVLVIASVAGLSLTGKYQGGLANAHLPGLSVRPSSYVTVLAAEWLIIFLIWLPLRSRGLSLSSVVSGSWQTLGSFFRDLGLAVGFIALIVAIETGIGYLLRATPDNALLPILPKTWSELAIWIALSATAGFCEEFIFRGYLTRQFRAWTGSTAWAIVIQGVVFGLGHAYYGAGVMFQVTIHGCLLGVLSQWRKSLRPAMLAHGIQDILGGVVAFLSRT
jgi:hypothetical protein